MEGRRTGLASAEGGPPSCGCGQILKPDVVFFGEIIPEQVLLQSSRLVEQCQLMLLIGTSGTVAPASLIPAQARRQGAMLIEVNLQPTALSPMCDLVLQGSATDVFPQIVKLVEQQLKA
jgi:NAD-dependent deacetylase